MTAPARATRGPAGPAPLPPVVNRAQGPEARNREISHHGPGAGSLKVTYQISTTKCAGRGQVRGDDTSQANYPRNSALTNRTGQTRTPNLMEHSTENTDGQKFKPARDSHPATNLESILCGLELASNTNITKPYKRTPYFRNLDFV